MPAPTDVHGVKRYCEMIQYLSMFLPNLTKSDLQPIRELTRKDADCNWSVECEEAFQKVIQKIRYIPVLVYFDPDKELVLQVDSSKDGWVLPSYKMGSQFSTLREHYKAMNETGRK